MATAVSQMQNDFQSAFKREIDAYLEKLQKVSARDAKRLRQLRDLAEDCGNAISDRFGAYAAQFDLDSGVVEAEAHQPDVAEHPEDAAANAALRARLADLEAELRRKTAQEDALRSELLERTKDRVDDALHQGSLDLARAREASRCSAAQAAEGGEAAAKGEQLRSALRETEALSSAASSLSVRLKQDRENNLRIADQRRRPLHPAEAELLTGAGDAEAFADERQRRAAESIARNQEECRRMQRRHHEELL